MPSPDPVSGRWETDSGRERLDLRLEEGGRVTGTVTSEGPSHAIPIASGRFEAGRLTLEGEAVPASGSAAVPFLIDGTLIASHRLDVSFRFGEFQGTSTFVRPSVRRALRRRVRGAVEWLLQRSEPIALPVVRYFRGLRRPSPATNARALRARGESIDAFVFRDATPDDIAALADLHAKTWAATYPGVQHPPTAALRESQWREAFHKLDGSWFTIVVERPDGQLIGFAKGIRHDNGVADLNKIYLLTDYQRLGLGRRLVGHVARRFLAMGQSSMRLSADAANPSCHFYYALGARNPREPDGRVHYGAFLWDDLEALSERCPM
jgi:ribosomal protein S18 acetylase RimI-like enzyme